MESWEGYNYYTTNTTTWVHLMNLSTAEFGLGYFPGDVVAIPGYLDSSTEFPDDTFVIELAGQGQFDEGRTVRIVLGVVTGVALLLGILWLWVYRKAILRPRNSGSQDDLAPRANSPTSRSTESTELLLLQGNRLCEASDFRDKLYHYYYESIDTEVELAEKTANDPVEVGDIEAVTTLVRKMYSYDIYLYGTQNVRNREAQQLDQMRKSDAILGAVRDRVLKEWAMDPNALGGLGWTYEERQQLSNLKDLLENRLPRQRYPYH
ncbi:hypothetical protein RRF57_009331 [Xylaria bambusicola]|uniref:Uncharacterized protein n=1 Tax=Xylaria bambusicola TaxID=326684 RepID=A0AAN7Z7S3_9PEZI